MVNVRKYEKETNKFIVQYDEISTKETPSISDLRTISRNHQQNHTFIYFYALF